MAQATAPILNSTVTSLAVMQQFGRDRVESGHRADIVDRSKMTLLGSGACIAAFETTMFMTEGEQYPDRCHADAATCKPPRPSLAAPIVFSNLEGEANPHSVCITLT